MEVSASSCAMPALGTRRCEVFSIKKNEDSQVEKRQEGEICMRDLHAYIPPIGIPPVDLHVPRYVL